MRPGRPAPADPPADRLLVPLVWQVPFLLAAIDPAAEDRLVGLTRATVYGRTLRADDAPVDETPGPTRTYPVLASSRPYVDAVIEAKYSRLRPPRVAGLQPDELEASIAAAPSTPIGTAREDVTANHERMMARAIDRRRSPGILETVVQPGPIAYDRRDDGVDTLAAVATVVLGAIAVADVLYLNIRERAAELATLRATGWTDAGLTRLVSYEGLGLGALGAVTGAVAGLGAAAWLVGEVPARLVLVAGLTAATGTLVAGLASAVPAILLRRIPTARLLAEE